MTGLENKPAFEADAVPVSCHDDSGVQRNISYFLSLLLVSPDFVIGFD